jgi:competence protein ComEA
MGGKGRDEAALYVPPSEEEVRARARVGMRRYVVLVAVVSLVVGGLVGYLVGSGAAVPGEAEPTLGPPEGWATLVPPPSPGTGELHVYVTGAVADSRVVTLPAGSLVTDALAAAGGASPDADLESLNLAAPLLDHEHLVVPTRAPTIPPATSVPSSPAPSPATRVDINAATVEELQALPGIGLTKAQNIVAHREANGPFESVEGLLEVSGIGEATLALLEPHVAVGP